MFEHLTKGEFVFSESSREPMVEKYVLCNVTIVDRVWLGRAGSIATPPAVLQSRDGGRHPRGPDGRAGLASSLRERPSPRQPHWAAFFSGSSRFTNRRDVRFGTR